MLGMGGQHAWRSPIPLTCAHASLPRSVKVRPVARSQLQDRPLNGREVVEAHARDGSPAPAKFGGHKRCRLAVVRHRHTALGQQVLQAMQRQMRHLLDLRENIGTMRRQTRVPAALLARPQSDRAGVREGEALAPPGRRLGSGTRRTWSGACRTRPGPLVRARQRVA